MALDHNIVVLCGRLGKDAENRVAGATGKSVTTLSVATSAGKDKTDWHKVIVWDAHDSVRNARKGDTILAEGRLTYNEWEDKEGRRVRTAEVLCFRCSVFDKHQRPDYDSGAGVPHQPAAQNYGLDANGNDPSWQGGGAVDEDLPF